MISDSNPHLNEIVRASQLVEPAVPSELVLEIASTAGGPKAITRFARELKAKPDLLHSARSDASPTASRFISALRSHGYEKFQLPQCSSCGRAVTLSHRDGSGGKHCDKCSRDARNKPCTRCGLSRAGGYRVLEGNPYCRTCFRLDPRSHKTCIICGRMGVPQVRKESGVICDCCYVAPADVCSFCGKLRPPTTRKNDRPLCQTCYRNLRDRVRTCTTCGAKRLCPSLGDQGPTCAECAGITDAGRCSLCGSDSHELIGRRCIRCVMPEKVQQLVTDDSGRPHPELVALKEYLLRDPDNCSAVLSWLWKSPMVKVVRDMANGIIPISLREVAKHPQPSASGYLAALLMESGAVPTENFERIRLELWQAEFYKRLDDRRIRSTIQRYATWVINPSFPTSGHLSISNDSVRLTRTKTHLSAVADLLGTIADQGFTLKNYPQRLFDAHVASRGRVGQDLTPFIRWAKAQKLTTLESRYTQYRLTGAGASEEQRWKWIDELIQSTELGTAQRLAGLLVLVYGVDLTKVVTVRRRAVDLQRGTIELGKDPISLPDRVLHLVREQLEKPQPNFWLFNGLKRGQHLTPNSISIPLSKRGINLSAGKYAARLSLSRDLPASIFADLTGMSITAATRWSELSGRDWVDYLRLRLPIATDPHAS